MPVNSGVAGKTLQKSCQKQQRVGPKANPFVLIWRVRKDCLQLAELEELLPVFVHFLLDLFDHPLVAGLEHVGKAALHLQVLLHRQLVLGLVAEDVFALNHLVQRPPQVSTAILVTSISFSLGYRQPRGQGAITFRNAAPGV